MTDLVERLRAYENSPRLWNAKCSCTAEAADEIERLRELKTPASRELLNITKASLDAANVEIERLRAALFDISQMWAGAGDRRDRPYDDCDKAAMIARRALGLRGQNAELELTGSRKELQLMLDQLGLDFERMRERAAKAEAEIERLRKALRNIIAGNGGECGCAETARYALGEAR